MNIGPLFLLTSGVEHTQKCSLTIPEVAIPELLTFFLSMLSCFSCDGTKAPIQLLGTKSLEGRTLPKRLTLFRNAGKLCDIGWDNTSLILSKLPFALRVFAISRESLTFSVGTLILAYGSSRRQKAKMVLPNLKSCGSKSAEGRSKIWQTLGYTD